jgi:transposase
MRADRLEAPTIAEEDAKRPSREREGLVGERTRIVNRIKSTLARLGVRRVAEAVGLFPLRESRCRYGVTGERR